MGGKNKNKNINNKITTNGASASADGDHQYAAKPQANITTTATISPDVGLHNGDDHDSPLKLFGEAKDHINNIFQKLDNCVSKASQFYTDNQLDPEISNQDVTNKLVNLKESIEGIRRVLSRNQMKVAFFGRTSNGKSTVINAILHDRVLPSGYGHTTGCFLQIEGSLTDEAYFEVMRNGEIIEKKPLQSIEHDVNALYSDSLEHSSLVKIHWPIALCPLLKYDVVLVDSPGVDVEDNLDGWIDQHCKDADVFVLVCNSESTLNNAEKKFFHRVSEKLSKPNIFILNNRWDSIADDPKSMDQVRDQHVKRAVEFLSDELQINTHEDAKRRIFFVSARETLNSRAPDSNRPNDYRREGYENREQEFINFERRFEESLSKSAVQTKFKKHTDRGLETLDDLKSILGNTRTTFGKLFQSKKDELSFNEARYGELHKCFYCELDNIDAKFQQMKEKILISTDDEFDHEISRLSRIVEDFEMKFSPNSNNLVYYKEQLYRHVEENLSENLRNRINSVITKGTNPIKKLLCDISLTLSEDRQKVIKELISESFVPDDLFDLLIYRQFYTEFHEDLEFRFSLGIFRILRKLQSSFSFMKSSSLDHNADTDFLTIVERFSMVSPQSPTMVGSLACGGLLVRTVGWRIIVVTTVVYGALYAYEYLTWTNAAKERTFKSQYTKYAQKGLRTVSESITKHIANSVEQKMNNVFVKFKNEMDTEKEQIQTKVSLLRISLEKLQACENFAQDLCGQSDVLKSELLNFATSFLT